MMDTPAEQHPAGAAGSHSGELVAVGALARHGTRGLATVDLDPNQVDIELYDVLPLGTMKRLGAAVIGRDGDTPVVAVSDPSNLLALDDLRMALPGCVIVVGDADAVSATIQRFRRHAERLEDEEAQRDNDVETILDQSDVSDDGAIARTVNRILDAAVQDGASDIHFEAASSGLVVRFRIDGVLQPFEELRKSSAAGIINRIKVISGMDIAKRVPQDGRFNRQLSQRTVDCRVETLPGAWDGEGAVVRLFDQGRGVQTLDQIGFHGSVAEKLRDAIAAPHGIVLVTGPTGSGKTTTLYSCLSEIATPERKTITIEDPCEIRTDGIVQVQVNEKGGLTFATALRSFLRADPDIILVGEVRDRETAELAAQAALTGHLVLSTLHTNEAVGAATRLANMGLEGYIIASSLRAVLAQRLVRRLCLGCRESYQPGPWDISEFSGADMDVPDLLWRAQKNGCRRCRKTGYAGRVPVAELVTISAPLSEAIIARASSHELMRIAVSEGTRPLKVDALEWVLSGDTSLDELRRGGLLL